MEGVRPDGPGEAPRRGPLPAAPLDDRAGLQGPENPPGRGVDDVQVSPAVPAVLSRIVGTSPREVAGVGREVRAVRLRARGQRERLPVESQYEAGGVLVAVDVAYGEERGSVGTPPVGSPGREPYVAVHAQDLLGRGDPEDADVALQRDGHPGPVGRDPEHRHGRAGEVRLHLAVDADVQDLRPAAGDEATVRGLGWGAVPWVELSTRT